MSQANGRLKCWYLITYATLIFAIIDIVTDHLTFKFLGGKGSAYVITFDANLVWCACMIHLISLKKWPRTVIVSISASRTCCHTVLRLRAADWKLVRRLFGDGAQTSNYSRGGKMLYFLGPQRKVENFLQVVKTNPV
jgi:hypothetical protein